MAVVSGMYTRKIDTDDTRKLVKIVTRSHSDRNFLGKRAAALPKMIALTMDRIATAIYWLTDIRLMDALSKNNCGAQWYV